MGTTVLPNPAKNDVFKPKTQGMKDQNAQNLMDSETQVNSKMPLDSSFWGRSILQAIPAL